MLYDLDDAELFLLLNVLLTTHRGNIHICHAVVLIKITQEKAEKVLSMNFAQDPEFTFASARTCCFSLWHHCHYLNDNETFASSSVQIFNSKKLVIYVSVTVS